MNCLTIAEQKLWLAQRGIFEEPYRNNESPKYYLQFYPPKHLRGMEAFSDYLNDLFWKEGEALLVFVDWPLYQPYEMRLVDHVRAAHNEKRWLIDAPGHVFAAEEKDDLISLFSLGIAFEWTSYLYFANAKVTLLNWEGVIFDFWTEDQSNLTSLLKAMADFKLEKTENQKRSKGSTK